MSVREILGICDMPYLATILINGKANVIIYLEVLTTPYCNSFGKFTKLKKYVVRGFVKFKV